MPTRVGDIRARGKNAIENKCNCLFRPFARLIDRFGQIKKHCLHRLHTRYNRSAVTFLRRFKLEEVRASTEKNIHSHIAHVLQNGRRKSIWSDGLNRFNFKNTILQYMFMSICVRSVKVECRLASIK